MLNFVMFFFFKQKTAYELRISDWSADVCASDLEGDHHALKGKAAALRRQHLVGHRLRAGQRVGLPGLACREEHRRDGEHEEAWGHGLSHFTVPTRTSSRICGVS